jgi:hypothetical protein
MRIHATSASLCPGLLCLSSPPCELPIQTIQNITLAVLHLASDLLNVNQVGILKNCRDAGALLVKVVPGHT